MAVGAVAEARDGAGEIARTSRPSQPQTVTAATVDHSRAFTGLRLGQAYRIEQRLCHLETPRIL
jgi:hypothetical protein